MANTKNNKIRVGSRGSRLAVVQVEEVSSLLKAANLPVCFDHQIYDTQGDKDKETSLIANTADDFFTDALDQALLKKEIDIAIHSAKDLPERLKEELEIFALTKSLDATDAFVGKVPLDQLSRGAKIGTSSELRQQSIKELYPQLETIDVRGTIEERINLVEKGHCDGIIIATIALKRLGLEEHIRDIFPWEATPLQGQLAIVGRKEDRALAKFFTAIDVRQNYGKVALVGAGPGDPELITVKGVSTLKQSDCVFYDYLAHQDILNYAPKAEKIYVGKRKGEHSLPQAELSKMLRLKAMEGKNVVRLKGGDPLIFGRGADEIDYLQSYYIHVDIVPGISAATGILSGLGVPLTARGVSSSVAFISGHGEDEKRNENKPVKVPEADTVIIFMGLTKLETICESFKEKGWDSKTPVMVVSRGTRHNEKIIVSDLNEIISEVKKNDLKPPALIVVGQTVRFYEERQLSNVNTLYLGTNPDRYKRLGNIVHFPMIGIEEVKIDSSVLKSINQVDLFLFTSRFAVHSFLKFLINENVPLEQLERKKIAVIGSETQHTLEMYELNASMIAKVETSQGMLEELKKLDLSRMNILFPRSSLPNPFLKEELKKAGANVQELVVYNNLKPARKDLPESPIDQVVFTSPSTVRNFLEDYGKIPSSWRILSRGPRTSQELEKAGYTSEICILN